MKMRLLLFVCFTVVIYHAGAQTDFYTNVTSLWSSGNSQEVLNIADQRLAQNTNDLAGLLLKFECEGEQLQFDNMTQILEKILAVGALYSGTNFSKEYHWLQSASAIFNIVKTNYTPEDYSAELAITNVSGRRLVFEDVLKALRDDGYFQ